ncbi:acyltransferase family protein [Paenibacillus thailandensis]|uniref:Acyltransferase family protein n=1 Tax=Paenibacillus thailandensis TaxID=393250 RepID=A0ABW5QYQ9_9BACL
MPRPVNNSGNYIPGLDGLRALAVLAVIAYHLGLKGLPGGLLGVSVFFTLSGYLITDLMLGERSRTGTIDMKRFWIRRARRLLPAMLLMLAALSGFLLVTDPSRLASLQGEIAASLLYITNWRQIFHEVSYFESFGPPSPIGHLWSLAVEEQFYLLWPLLVLLLLRFKPRRGTMAGFALVLAAASAAAMAYLYDPDSDPSRVYYGTDTRAFGMLLGAALAFVWPSRKLAGRTAVGRGTRLALDGVGAAALAALAVMMATVGEYDPFLYQGGMVLLSVATAAVVAVIVHPAGKVGALLGWKPLRWLGVRSYGIYLWHYPVIVLSTPAVDTGDAHPVRSLLQLLATLALSALSWRFIEEPIRQGGIGKMRQRLAKPGRRTVRLAFASAAGLTAMVLGLFVSVEKLVPEITKAASSQAEEEFDTVSGHTAALHNGAGGLSDDAHGTATVPPEAGVKGPAGGAASVAKPGGDAAGAKEPDPGTGAGKAGGEAGPAGTPEPPAGPSPSATPAGEGGVPGSSAGGGPEGEGTPPPAAESPAASASPGATAPPYGDADGAEKPSPGATDGALEAVRSGEHMTALGDSIMLDIEPYLSELLPGIAIDGKIGRQFREANDIAAELAAKGKLGDYVVIALGSNGAFSQKQLDTLMATLKDVKQVLLVNTRVPRDWQDKVNEMLDEAEGDYDNVKVVDWYAASKGKDEYFAKDGVHLNKTGSIAYAALIADALD